jgi:hypothetical protein
MNLDPNARPSLDQQSSVSSHSTLMLIGWILLIILA